MILYAGILLATAVLLIGLGAGIAALVRVQKKFNGGMFG